MPKTIDELFTEFELELVLDHQACSDHDRPVNVILGEAINPALLPYKENFSDETLKDFRVRRINQCVIHARGDSRSPQQILEAGGFHPQATNGLFFRPKNVFNVFRHRSSTKGSGLVSFTSSLKIARRFAIRSREITEGIPADSYIYFAKTLGAISPDSSSCVEAEYSMPAGVDFEDIVGFRKLAQDRYVQSVFISNEFLEKYPAQVGEMLEVMTHSIEDYSKALNNYIAQHVRLKM